MSKLSAADQELFVTYIKKMVPEIMVSWNIEKKEAIKLAAERWNDMSQAQKLKYDKEVKKGLTAQMAYSIAQKQKGDLKTQTQTQTQAKQKEKKPEKPEPPKKVLIQVKPKKTMTPYMYYITEYQKDTTNRIEGEPFSNIMKKGAEIWNGMEGPAKQKYIDMSEGDRVRHDREVDEFTKTGFFTNKEGINSKDVEPKYQIVGGKGGKNVPAPDLIHKPKKACVAFMFYVKAMSPTLMKENPDCKSAADVTKILGKKWGEMDDAAKKPYTDLNQKDKERHERQVKEFEKTGKWTLEDGSSSDTLGPKKQKIKKGPRLLQKRVYAGDS